MADPIPPEQQKIDPNQVKKIDLVPSQLLFSSSFKSIISLIVLLFKMFVTFKHLSFRQMLRKVSVGLLILLLLYLFIRREWQGVNLKIFDDAVPWESISTFAIIRRCAVLTAKLYGLEIGLKYIWL